MKLLTTVLIGLLLAGASGCSTHPGESDRDAASTETSSRGVLHLVTVTEGRQPDQYEVAINPWKYRVTRETWIDLDTGAVRESSVDTPTTTQVEGTHFREQLTNDGVLTVVERSEYPSSPDSGSSHVFIHDAEPATDVSLAREPVADSRDPQVYRSLVTSGPAEIKLETPDTLTLTVETDAEDGTTGRLLTVIVSAQDYTPLSLEGESWSTSTPARPGERVITERWVTEYQTVEIVPHADLPDGTFEIAWEAGTPVSVDRTLDLADASESTSPTVYWLGEAWREYDRQGDISLRADEGGFNSWGIWGTPNFFGSRDSRQWAEHVLPFRDRLNPVVTLTYGDDAGGPTLYCATPFDLDTAVAVYEEAGLSEVIHHTLAPGQAVSLRSEAETNTVTVAVDLGDAVVVLQCWKMTLDEALDAAGSLRRVDQP